MALHTQAYEKNSKYYDKNGYGAWPKEAFTKEEGYSIFSIKNSNGTEFSIGDLAKNDIGNFKIDSIELYDSFPKGGYLIGKIDGISCGISIEIANKIKPEPLFTTEDGIKLKEGDVIWFINNNNANWRYLKFNTTHPETKYFSTKEACDEWLKEHKPLYSLADIRKILIEVQIPNFIAAPPDGKRHWINLEDLKSLNK